MKEFISVIIFSLPGLLTYFWIQLFGINPTAKHSPAEMIGLAALLWAPTALFTILVYNIGYKIFDALFRWLSIDLTFLKLDYLYTLQDLNKMSHSLVFILLFISLCLCSSFLVAFIWSIHLYKKMLDLVNKIRIKRRVIKLSEDTSVWDSFFYKLEESKEEQIVVELYKIDKPDEKVCGAVVRMSRPFETDRSIIIDYTKGWDESHKYYNYKIKNVYVDIKAGIVINELDYKTPSTFIITD